MIWSDDKMKELFKLSSDGYLFHRESRELEFKEQFNLADLAEYFRDFAAFGNNVGGYIIFGISNNPRELKGLTVKSLEQFNKIDPARISGYLLEIFSQEIEWEQQVKEIEGKKFGLFYVHESRQKPIIAKKDEGKSQEIKNGDIYYRYGGRTQKIQFAELEGIILKRIDDQNKNWSKLISKIAKIGPSNAAILDLEKGVIEKDQNKTLVIDEKILDKIKFIKDGKGSQEKEAVLKIVGDVTPVDTVEVVKIKEKRITELYPYSAMQIVGEIKKRIPSANTNLIWDIIKENDLKNDATYSAYNFRNRTQEEEYEKTRIVPSGTPSIYNQAAIEFIVKVLKQV